MQTDALSPVGSPQLVRERAVHSVREAIITGRIAPGARLIERELCEALGISRPSVREVIRQLESEKLVKVEPRKGPTVVKLTAREARELYEVRGMFEMLLAERFTRMADAEAVAGLRAIWQRIREASERRDVQALVALMTEFDAHMDATVQHGVVMDLLRHLHARISALRVTSMSREGRIEAGWQELDAVVRAVEARKPEAAAAAMQVYVENARDSALAMLEAEGD